MSKLYYFIALLIVGIGVWASLNFGHEEVQSTNIIPLTYIESPSHAAAKIIDSFSEKIKKNPLIYIGVYPDSQDDMILVNELLSALQKNPELSLQHIISEPLLAQKVIIQKFVTDELDTKDDRQRLIAGLGKAKELNQRVAVIVPTIYSSQLIRNNPVNLLMTESKLKILSISLVPLKYNQDDPTDLMYPCRVENDLEGYGAIGCEIQKRSSQLRGRKAIQNGFVMIIDKMSENDFFVYYQKIK